MSVATEGGQVITYSPRFSLTGMSGTTEKKYVDAAADAGTKVPSTEDQTANNADAAAGDAAANSGIPLESQTGLMRFAPMQSVPPTKITKKDTKPLYPTSSYKIAVSFLPTPSVTKTQTASQTFSADSMENTVCSPESPCGNASKVMIWLTRYTGLSSAWSGRRHAQVPQPLEGLDCFYLDQSHESLTRKSGLIRTHSIAFAIIC